ncbi:DUF5677 domain-containing protein [Microbacterium sp. cx-55]|uniref:DUF5677 domain-containing protein n=1 Tax=Microbacterium sp. cx-55 TaxID=2875948 RepID=UPI001CC07721|nr:DUF5677 domain-containing protein [Microbacterium sp. cx-55]MBZ4488085.1 DUF5677 domain-containing protein [Microbacterium sp. cx-55]UGB34506.1 DUF5677 domain-containing protein [Microbacterium sp. cx-55]
MTNERAAEKELAGVQAWISAEAPGLAEDFLQLGRESRARREAKEADVAERIAHLWARGWTVFDAVVAAMEQSAALMFDRSEIEDNHAPTREALMLIQSASTLTLREIQVLLRAGYLSGASARWRALHELAVTAILVAEGGPDIAQRYLDHGIMTQFVRLEEFYRQPHPEAPSDEERAERLTLVRDLTAKHTLADETIAFGRPYGWATPLMPRRRDGKFHEPSFTRLETAARQADMRLLVQHGAHGHVHHDAGAVRTAVLVGGTKLIAGPRDDEIPSVAVPALRTVVSVAAATHMGFEPEFSEFGKLISLTAASIADLSMRGVDEFKNVHRSTRLLF